MRDTSADRRGLVLAAEPVASNEVSAPLVRRLKKNVLGNMLPNCP
jgi:hypothetical protein